MKKKVNLVEGIIVGGGWFFIIKGISTLLGVSIPLGLDIILQVGFAAYVAFGAACSYRWGLMMFGLLVLSFFLHLALPDFKVISVLIILWIAVLQIKIYWPNLLLKVPVIGRGYRWLFFLNDEGVFEMASD